MRSLSHMHVPNWDELYYCMMVESMNGYLPRLIGVGSTIIEAKRQALKNIDKYFYVTEAEVAAIQCIALNEFTMLQRNSKPTLKLTLKYCDYKTYLYSKDVGIEKVLCTLSPYTIQSVALFAGVRADYDEENRRKQHPNAKSGYRSKRRPKPDLERPNESEGGGNSSGGEAL